MNRYYYELLMKGKPQTVRTDTKTEHEKTITNKWN